MAAGGLQTFQLACEHVLQHGPHGVSEQLSVQLPEQLFKGISKCIRWPERADGQVRIHDHLGRANLNATGDVINVKGLQQVDSPDVYQSVCRMLGVPPAHAEHLHQLVKATCRWQLQQWPAGQSQPTAPATDATTSLHTYLCNQFTNRREAAITAVEEGLADRASPGNAALHALCDVLGLQLRIRESFQILRAGPRPNLVKIGSEFEPASLAAQRTLYLAVRLANSKSSNNGASTSAAAGTSQPKRVFSFFFPREPNSRLQQYYPVQDKQAIAAPSASVLSSCVIQHAFPDDMVFPSLGVSVATVGEGYNDDGIWYKAVQEHEETGGRRRKRVWVLKRLDPGSHKVLSAYYSVEQAVPVEPQAGPVEEPQSPDADQLSSQPPVEVGEHADATATSPTAAAAPHTAPAAATSAAAGAAGGLPAQQADRTPLRQPSSSSGFKARTPTGGSVGTGPRDLQATAEKLYGFLAALEKPSHAGRPCPVGAEFIKDCAKEATEGNHTALVQLAHMLVHTIAKADKIVTGTSQSSKDQEAGETLLDELVSRLRDIARRLQGIVRGGLPNSVLLTGAPNCGKSSLAASMALALQPSHPPDPQLAQLEPGTDAFKRHICCGPLMVHTRSLNDISEKAKQYYDDAKQLPDVSTAAVRGSQFADRLEGKDSFLPTAPSFGEDCTDSRTILAPCEQLQHMGVVIVDIYTKDPSIVPQTVDKMKLGEVAEEGSEEGTEAVQGYRNQYSETVCAFIGRAYTEQVPDSELQGSLPGMLMHASKLRYIVNMRHKDWPKLVRRIIFRIAVKGHPGLIDRTVVYYPSTTPCKFRTVDLAGLTSHHVHKSKEAVRAATEEQYSVLVVVSAARSLEDGLRQPLTAFKPRLAGEQLPRPQIVAAINCGKLLKPDEGPFDGYDDFAEAVVLRHDEQLQSFILGKGSSSWMLKWEAASLKARTHRQVLFARQSDLSTFFPDHHTDPQVIDKLSLQAFMKLLGDLHTRAQQQYVLDLIQRQFAPWVCWLFEVTEELCDLEELKMGLQEDGEAAAAVATLLGDARASVRRDKRWDKQLRDRTDQFLQDVFGQLDTMQAACKAVEGCTAQAAKNRVEAARPDGTSHPYVVPRGHVLGKEMAQASFNVSFQLEEYLFGDLWENMAEAYTASVVEAWGTGLREVAKLTHAAMCDAFMPPSPEGAVEMLLRVLQQQSRVSLNFATEQAIRAVRRALNPCKLHDKLHPESLVATVWPHCNEILKNKGARINAARRQLLEQNVGAMAAGLQGALVDHVKKTLEDELGVWMRRARAAYAKWEELLRQVQQGELEAVEGNPLFQFGLELRKQCIQVIMSLDPEPMSSSMDDTLYKIRRAAAVQEQLSNSNADAAFKKQQEKLQRELLLERQASAAVGDGGASASSPGKRRRDSQLGSSEAIDMGQDGQEADDWRCQACACTTAECKFHTTQYGEHSVCNRCRVHMQGLARQTEGTASVEQLLEYAYNKRKAYLRRIRNPASSSKRPRV